MSLRFSAGAGTATLTAYSPSILSSQWHNCSNRGLAITYIPIDSPGCPVRDVLDAGIASDGPDSKSTVTTGCVRWSRPLDVDSARAGVYRARPKAALTEGWSRRCVNGREDVKKMVNLALRPAERFLHRGLSGRSRRTN